MNTVTANKMARHVHAAGGWCDDCTVLSDDRPDVSRHRDVRKTRKAADDATARYEAARRAWEKAAAAHHQAVFGVQSTPLLMTFDGQPAFDNPAKLEAQLRETRKLEGEAQEKRQAFETAFTRMREAQRAHDAAVARARRQAAR